VLRAGAARGQAGSAAAGGGDLFDDDPLVAEAGRPADRAGRDPGGHGGHLGILETAVYLLEAHGFETWLVNARDVKHLPGRPKTDKLDAVWLCKVAERQMIRPSFVPPPQIRRLREALLRWGGRSSLLGWRRCSDGEGEFGEDRFEPAAGLGIEAEFVVSAGQVLDERMPATDNLRGADALRPRIGRVRASTGRDRVGARNAANVMRQ
jgi:hypothetical protein